MFRFVNNEILFTAFEVFSVTAVNCFIKFFLRIIIEYLAIFVPFILTVTVCNAFASIITPVLFTLSVIIFTVCLCSVSNYSWNPSLPAVIKSDAFIVPEVNRLYSNLMICVYVAILAVDFRIFPVRFAKTALYGISLMDVGVGCFIAINAGLSPEVRKPMLFDNTRGALKNSFTSCIPLLFMGIQRLVVVKGIDYHQQIIEYGVHWNFFFTLAFTKMFASLLCCFVKRSDLILILAIVTGVIHQIFLICGISSFIQNNDRNGIIAANKEGIFSLPGYVSLYLLFVAIGKYWRRVVLREKNADHISSFVVEMPSVIIFTGLLTILSHVLIEKISRREANLGYICWITTLIIYLALTEHTFSLAVIYLIRLGVLDHNSTLFVGHSIVCAAIAKNPLIIFLIANILTGLVNITFHTMTFDAAGSLLILFVYTFILSVFAVFLYIKNIKLRIPNNINIYNKFVYF
ncbi:phosphatidylinositol-glycan biosynthesis class W protein-like protein [Leptotrombidium deliense]|uniref:Phosphatidylinositol-glycan biosynthesis class W protein n=1 Tax=Leptotrombidium deliense TaxID=299467 RepID=A0A443SSE2_9ACAR|nr:phosphatidylinositol-glycan biosynthesis class W protein-like protein [Leptotrombidium deliense]